MPEFYITLYEKQFNNEHNKFESMKMIYSFAQNNLEFYSYLKRTNIDITHFFFSKKEKKIWIMCLLKKKLK
jgi:hypothetical protein